MKKKPTLRHQCDIDLIDKQGDALAMFMGDYKGDLVKALRAWSRQLAGAARDIQRIADAVRGQSIELTGAEGVYISLEAGDDEAAAVLAALAKKKLLR